MMLPTCARRGAVRGLSADCPPAGGGQKPPAHLRPGRLHQVELQKLGWVQLQVGQAEHRRAGAGADGASQQPGPLRPGGWVRRRSGGGPRRRVVQRVGGRRGGDVDQRGGDGGDVDGRGADVLELKRDAARGGERVGGRSVGERDPDGARRAAGLPARRGLRVDAGCSAPACPLGILALVEGLGSRP